MRAYFGRRYRFSASHRLHANALGAEENQAAYGKCNNPFGHGHNYVLEVRVGGDVDAETGMVCNLVDLDACVRKEVLDVFDHTNLNLQECFNDANFYRNEARELFKRGQLDLRTRSLAENLFLDILQKIARLTETEFA